MRWKRAAGTGQRFQPPADDCRLLESLLTDQPLSPGLDAEHRRPRVSDRAARTASTISR